MTSRKQPWIAAILLGSMLTLALLMPSMQSWLMDSKFHGRWLDVPAPDFQLDSNQEKTASLKDFSNQYILLYFGYLHCDGLCQQQWVTLFHVMNQLKAEPIKSILVTIDPSRDSQQDLETLANNLGPNFIAIRGTQSAQIQTLANAYHAPFSKQGNWINGQDYSIDHSGDIFLIAPDKRIKLVYSGTNWTYDDIVEDYRKLTHPKESSSELRTTN